MLTHANETFAADTAVRAFQCTAADRVLAFMPLSNATERALTLYMPIVTGALVYYCDDLARLHDHMSAVQPTLIFSAPILWERFEAVFRAKLGTKEPGSLPSAVRKKLRKFIGCSRLRLGLSGNSVLHPSTIAFFRALDMNLLSIYTRTSLSGLCTFDDAANPADVDVRRLGKPVPGVEIKISPEDGQVWVRGPNVCSAYYGQTPFKVRRYCSSLQSQLTLVGKAGEWHPTGDVGSVDGSGRLMLEGRLDTQLTLKDGRKVFVEPIELELASSPFVSGAMVVGEGRDHIGAILALERDAFKELAAAAKTSVNEYALSAATLQMIDKHVQAVNAGLPAKQRVKAYKVLPREFSVREGECTPSMQVNRAFCNQKFKTLINSLF